MDYDDILDRLMDLAVKREEHFQMLEKDIQKLEELLKKSEERIDRTNEITLMLMRAISDTYQEKQNFYNWHNKGKEGIISRYEKKLDKAEARCDTLQRQNDELVKEVSMLNRQIEKTDEYLIFHRVADSSAAPNITVGNFKVDTDKHNGIGK